MLPEKREERVRINYFELQFEDDLDQPIGTDFETYTMILQEVLKQFEGEQMGIPTDAGEMAHAICRRRKCNNRCSGNAHPG